MRFTSRQVRFSLLCLAIASAPTLRGVAQALGSGSEHPTSKLDIYAGYGFFHPVNSSVAGYNYQDIKNINTTASISAYFNRYLGAQLEGEYFSGNAEHKIYGATSCTSTRCSQLIYTGEAGPVVRFPIGPFVPFVHALGGGARLNGPAFQNLSWGWGITGGGGLDLVLPYWNSRFAVRAVQADFEHDHVNYGTPGPATGALANSTGGIGNLNGIKLSAGLVVRFGQEAPPPAMKFGCSASPTSIYPGDPVVVTGTALNLGKNSKPIYSWSTNGGTITSNGATATVATADLAPGEYTVIGHVTVGRGTKHQAFCTTPFTVQAYVPPVVACTAAPSTVEAGTDTPVEINCKGKSQQSRPLSYTATTTAGTLTMNGSTGVLSTAGLSEGPVTVTCAVVDDLAQTAKCQVVIAITPKVIPPKPDPIQLCTLDFTLDKRRPLRVDNRAKACLDDVAQSLVTHSDGTLIMVGYYAEGEKDTAAMQRVLNAKQYLTQEKGIEGSRITLRIGIDPKDKSVTNTEVLPISKKFDETGTREFDADKVVRHGQAYGIKHPRHPILTK